jgi:CIC family chloride channel protein
MLGNQFFPVLVPDVTPFVVVGMGAFFAGVANAPMASLVMVAELTGAYELLPPLMVVAVLALITSRRWSIYTTQVENKFSSRAHLWEMNPKLLKRMTIDDAMRGSYGRSAIISHGLPFTRIEAFSSESGERDLLLEDDEGGLAGLLSLDDLGKPQDFEHASALLLADDLVNRRTIYLSPHDNLIRALEFFGESEFDKLPIVDSSDGTNKLLGYVRYRDIIAFYQAEHDSPIAQSRSPST